MPRISSVSLLCLLVVSLLVSCNSNRVFEDYTNLEHQEWHKDSLVVFEVEISDNNIPHDLSITLRYHLDYAYHNIYYQFQLLDDNGGVLETGMKEVVLFDPKTGKPLGSGISDAFDVQSAFLSNYKFPSAGKYTVSLQQYMRMEKLPNIISVGSHIAKISE